MQLTWKTDAPMHEEVGKYLMALYENAQSQAEVNRDILGTLMMIVGNLVRERDARLPDGK